MPFIHSAPVDSPQPQFIPNTPPPEDILDNIEFTPHTRPSLSEQPSPARQHIWQHLFPNYLTAIPTHPSTQIISHDIPPHEIPLHENFYKFVVWTEDILTTQKRDIDHLTSVVSTLKEELHATIDAVRAIHCDSIISDLAHELKMARNICTALKTKQQTAISAIRADLTTISSRKSSPRGKDKSFQLLEERVEDVAVQVQEVERLALKIAYLKSRLPESELRCKKGFSAATGPVVGIESQFDISLKAVNLMQIVLPLPVLKPRTRLPSSAPLRKSTRVQKDTQTKRGSTMNDKINTPSKPYSVIPPRSEPTKPIKVSLHEPPKKRRKHIVKVSSSALKDTPERDRQSNVGQDDGEMTRYPEASQRSALQSTYTTADRPAHQSQPPGAPLIPPTTIPSSYCLSSSKRRHVKKNLDPRIADGVRLTKKGVPDGRMGNYKNLRGYYERKIHKEIKEEEGKLNEKGGVEKTKAGDRGSIDDEREEDLEEGEILE